MDNIHKQNQSFWPTDLRERDSAAKTEFVKMLVLCYINWITKIQISNKAPKWAIVQVLLARGVVDGWASCDAACHAGGPGLIPGPGQTYV
jgi:hypothetical protein